MAEACCGFCEALGYRSCDKCGAPVFWLVPDRSDELCGYCLVDLGVVLSGGAEFDAPICADGVPVIILREPQPAL